MKKITLLLMFVMLGFVGVQTAHAVGGEVGITDLHIKKLAANAEANTREGGGQDMVNARIAISPYAQVVADETYTFIGISHPSLATAHTSIGVAVEVLGMTTVPNTQAGAAQIFTVSAGETHRVFVVNQGHGTINLSNSAFTDSQTHLITTADTSQFGSVKVTSVGTLPTKATTDAKRVGGKYGTGATGTIERLDNVSQLAMWGVVYQASNGAGFSMEFIGDMHDSSAGGVASHGGEIGRVQGSRKQVGTDNTHAAGGTSNIDGGVGRGIN